MSGQVRLENVKLLRLPHGGLKIEQDEFGKEFIIGNPLEVLSETDGPSPSYDGAGTIYTGWDHNCLTLADLLPEEIRHEAGTLILDIQFIPNSFGIATETETLRQQLAAAQERIRELEAKQ